MLSGDTGHRTRNKGVMKTNSPMSRFSTFHIYVRPTTPERSNQSWLGGLEHGYTVNAQGFFVLFDLSNVESFWHQIDFCKSLRLYRDIPVITIGNVTCKHRMAYLPPELHYIQVNVRSEHEALRPLTEMRLRLGQIGDVLPCSRESLAAMSAMKGENDENDEDIHKKQSP
ncbi:uncharacterized protein LOC111244680 isoform X2 [Varroa destructor]|uniref:Uncharacterized protein n=1 Tax=Varroa destructor TaxID=109461 RepID=A0A7M7J716_VARDE|nr:uncharacterized protein LOC111244680 isoform X2 [Varroa destructor]